MPDRPLSSLNDSELLDLLDAVSAEVKRRNSLNIHLGNDDFDDQSAKRAVEYLSQLITSLPATSHKAGQ